MSPIGPKRTCLSAEAAAAFGGKADIPISSTASEAAKLQSRSDHGEVTDTDKRLTSAHLPNLEVTLAEWPITGVISAVAEKGYVRLWPKADTPISKCCGSFRRNSGHRNTTASRQLMTQSRHSECCDRLEESHGLRFVVREGERIRSNSSI
jgi:hypothetical protein